MLKAGIIFLGCITCFVNFSSGVSCVYPDGCNAARSWVASAFFYCWFGTFAFLLIRLSNISEKISKFDRFNFVWSIFACINYWIAALVLSCYLKCVSYGNAECASRLTANFFGYVVALLTTFEIFYELHLNQNQTL